MPFRARITLACALLIASAPAAWAAATPAPALDDALAAARHDIDIAAAELEQVRNTISAARIPLAAKLQRRQAEILALRAAVGSEQERGRRDALTIEALRSEVRRLHEDAQFVETMLDEYRRGLETRIAAGEVAYLAALLAPEETPDPADDAAPAPAALADRARNLIEAAMRLQRERIGGLRPRNRGAWRQPSCRDCRRRIRTPSRPWSGMVRQPCRLTLRRAWMPPTSTRTPIRSSSRSARAAWLCFRCWLSA